MDPTPRQVALWKSRLGLELTPDEANLVDGRVRHKVTAYTRTCYKLRLGLELTAEDREVRRQYMQKYQPCKAAIHIRVETKRDWEARAQAAGVTLSTWILQRVQMSQRDHAPEVDALRRDVAAREEEAKMLRRTLAEGQLREAKLEEQLRFLRMKGLDIIDARITQRIEA